MELLSVIRRWRFRQHYSIREIARRTGLSRNTVRKYLRSDSVEPKFNTPGRPSGLDPYADKLSHMLRQEAAKSRKQKRTAKQLHADLIALGYEGSYNRVAAFAREWKAARHREQQTCGRGALCRWRSCPARRSSSTGRKTGRSSRASGPNCRSRTSSSATAARSFCAPIRSRRMRCCSTPMSTPFAFFKAACQRGIYDNMNTAVETICIGKERQYNRRFSANVLASPRRAGSCTPASGWEKGQIENQVGLVRERFFTPRLRFKSFDELNAWLLDKCLAWAKAHPHPEQSDRTIWEMFEDERPKLIAYRGRFDGFHSTPASVSKTCLVRFDNNRYSVNASAVGRPVEIHAYADRLVIRQDGRVVGEHPRKFGRGQTEYDAWHYVPVLARKPGALRNGAPFKDWVLPAALDRVRRKLSGSDEGDRQMVKVLAAVLTDGLPAVEAACAQALAEGVHSADVILNILARRREPPAPAAIATPASLALRHAPVANCARYDSLRSI